MKRFGGHSKPQASSSSTRTAVAQGSVCESGNRKKANSLFVQYEGSAAAFFRNRAPGPPPFSSMNSTPAVASAFLAAHAIGRHLSFTRLCASQPDSRPSPIFIDELHPRDLQHPADAGWLRLAGGELGATDVQASDTIQASPNAYSAQSTKSSSEPDLEREGSSCP